MADYTHEYSNYPNTVMVKKTYRDATDADAEIINAIKELIENNNISSAAQLAQQIYDCVITAKDFNWATEEIRNAEIYAKSIKQSIYPKSEPVDPLNDDVWIGGE